MTEMGFLEIIRKKQIKLVRYHFFPIFPSAPWGVENVNQLNWSWPTDQLQI